MKIYITTIDGARSAGLVESSRVQGAIKDSAAVIATVIKQKEVAPPPKGLPRRLPLDNIHVDTALRSWMYYCWLSEYLLALLRRPQIECTVSALVVRNYLTNSPDSRLAVSDFPRRDPRVFPHEAMDEGLDYRYIRDTFRSYSVLVDQLSRRDLLAGRTA
jgi:hypothetical protein